MVMGFNIWSRSFERPDIAQLYDFPHRCDLGLIFLIVHYQFASLNHEKMRCGILWGKKMRLFLLPETSKNTRFTYLVMTFVQ